MIAPCKVGGCVRVHYGKGYCRMHYRRVATTGSTELETLEQRFWKYVEKTDTCWIWVGYKDPNGYGRLSIANVPRLAHRLAWGFEHDTTPTRLDHICRNTSCVNTQHLRPVTQKQNQENLGAVRKNNTSGYRGVGWDKRRLQWRAYIKDNYKYVHVGYFGTAEEANDAVVEMRNRLFTHNDEDRN